MLNLKTFSFVEALNNSKGKSSLGLLLGLLYGLAALILYCIGTYCIFHGILGYVDIYTQAAILTGASSTLIGVRRFTKDKELNTEENNGSNTITSS